MSVKTPHRRYRYQHLEVKTEHKPNIAFLRLGFVLLIGMVAGISYIWLQHATDRLNRVLQVKRHDYSVGTKEMENQRMELESYKNPHYITSKVVKMQMGLRPPLPGQVRRLSLEGNARRTDYSIDGLSTALLSQENLAQQEKIITEEVAYP